MRSVARADAAVTPYVLSVFLLISCLVFFFQEEASVLSSSIARLPVLAGVLAFIGARHPSAGIGSIVVIISIEPIMGKNVYQMTAEENLWSFYYDAIIFILLGGVAVHLFAWATAKRVAAI